MNDHPPPSQPSRIPHAAYLKKEMEEKNNNGKGEKMPQQEPERPSPSLLPELPLLLERLKNSLRRIAPEGIALAYSGGVDSSLLLNLLKILHDEAPFPLLALTIHSVFQDPHEMEAALSEARNLGVELEFLEMDPFSIPEMKNNPPDRCYWCKRRIFSLIRRHAEEKGLKWVMDGSNADDLKTYRPGLAALKESAVLSPLAELGIGKKQVRLMASELALPTARKASVPCLATRFEYGFMPEEKDIENVIAGEALLRTLLPASADIRLRVHRNVRWCPRSGRAGEKDGNPNAENPCSGKEDHKEPSLLARIEVSENALGTALLRRGEMTAGLEKLGFRFVTLDLKGFRSGSMDDPPGEMRRENGTSSSS